VVREAAALARRSERPASFALDAEVGLPSAAARVAFAEDLAAAVTAVVQRHHVDGGVPHRLLVAAHPIPTDEEDA
jgi:hypothetical protein